MSGSFLLLPRLVETRSPSPSGAQRLLAPGNGMPVRHQAARATESESRSPLPLPPELQGSALFFRQQIFAQQPRLFAAELSPRFPRPVGPAQADPPCSPLLPSCLRQLWPAVARRLRLLLQRRLTPRPLYSPARLCLQQL